MSNSNAHISIKNARTNNLKSISLDIPHNKFIVVTGISGSGKSSLIFDVIAKEGQRRYFETLPSFTRQFVGKLNRPDVDSIEGISPVIMIGQKTTGMHARSTVGTLSDIYDLMRLLYARTGVVNEKAKGAQLSRALFSFNSDIGKCKHCQGIGKEEKIDIDKLVASPDKTIREGALAPTLPTGYIMYSQVTIDVLSQVCAAEGFDVDTPWINLTGANKKVVLYGSDKIKVPFGKHSLESRLKWTGIKAKPREEGYYKGMMPIMTDILRRDRNANILKYVSSVTCEICEGKRLNQVALGVKVKKQTIDEMVSLEIGVLNQWLRKQDWDTIGQKIIDKIVHHIDLLERLGLGYLNLNRPANTLSGSEIQRIRVVNQLTADLSHVLYIFDEPSIGLHPEENRQMIRFLKNLVVKGNTVIVVEHDLETIRSADWIIDIGPQAGTHGGELLFNGSYQAFISDKKLKTKSLSYNALISKHSPSVASSVANKTFIHLNQCNKNNLKHIDVKFQIGGLNVVSGKSGVGKSSLIKQTLLPLIQQHLGIDVIEKICVGKYQNIDCINQLLFVDQSPIGRTPRSNPATYLGLSDTIRDLFASLAISKEMKFTKSRFSFNVKGGRCETCLGAGKIQIGMHFLGNVDLPCGTCKGLRFNEETLQIKYKNKSIASIYSMTVDEAIPFFEGQKKIINGLQLLKAIGLGYLSLGQSSTTLSGGEAQRIKIANQLQKKISGNTLYLLEEPSIGLHHYDLQKLVQLFHEIIRGGDTIVCIEQDETIIQNADWCIELGPGNGKEGGEIIFQGPYRKEDTIQKKDIKKKSAENSNCTDHSIVLKGITTHHLKNIDVTIPRNQISVVTGLSGSGKSSLVFDTLYAEANSRFTESLSTYNRSFLKQSNQAQLKESYGLGPVIAIKKRVGSGSKRSTVGTLTGVYDHFRLLYSRIGQLEGRNHTAQSYSFNHQLGACSHCKGLGQKLTCDPDGFISDPSKSILDGPFVNNKSANYYTDVDGQFVAILKEVAHQNNWNIEVSWNDLDEAIKQVILYGTGDQKYNVIWKYKTKYRSGNQSLSSQWLGFCNYIDEEYKRKIQNKNITALEALMHEVECKVCAGSRLKAELLETTFQGMNIDELTQRTISDCLQLLNQPISNSSIKAIAKVVLFSIKSLFTTVIELGLGYLNLNRSMPTLSGGEYQRVQLAGQLSSHLYGVTYVLDEPTIGLDQNQIVVLIKLIKQLIKKGNTVVVVEHDPTFIEQADYLIELGPCSGREGGELIYQGRLKDLEDSPATITHQLLNVKKEVKKSIVYNDSTLFGIRGAFKNNLKNIDVVFHTNQLIAVTGNSGSGKSSLIKDVLYASFQRDKPVGCSSIYGMEYFDKVLMVDQTTSTFNASTTPITFTGIFESIKRLFSKTEIAKNKGFKTADFSFQSKKGKCLVCNGLGQQKTSMDFMSMILMPCESCQGLRYDDEILTCTYQSVSIGVLLQMTINEAIDFFEDVQIQKELKQLKAIGIGHLQLGQAGDTLSGGETQRLKLAKEILNNKGEKNLYLFDEPSTGLHYFDLLRLIDVFENMLKEGHTIIVIEHNETLINYANQIITLGPESGQNGGYLV